MQNQNNFMENKEDGYIMLYRSLKKNWIWDDPVKLKWWLDILFSARHEKEIKMVNIKNSFFECGRGQSLKSLLRWGKEWNVDKNVVRNFFTLLQKDKMITIENLKLTTRLTICNYDEYQTNLHANKTQTKRKQNAEQTTPHTNNNDNNDNNDNNEINIPSDFEKTKSDFHQKDKVSLKENSIKEFTSDDEKNIKILHTTLINTWTKIIVEEKDLPYPEIKSGVKEVKKLCERLYKSEFNPERVEKGIKTIFKYESLLSNFHQTCLVKLNLFCTNFDPIKDFIEKNWDTPKFKEFRLKNKIHD